MYLVLRQVVDDFGNVVEETPVNMGPNLALAVLDAQLSEGGESEPYVRYDVEPI